VFQTCGYAAICSVRAAHPAIPSVSRRRSPFCTLRASKSRGLKRNGAEHVHAQAQRLRLRVVIHSHPLVQGGLEHGKSILQGAGAAPVAGGGALEPRVLRRPEWEKTQLKLRSHTVQRGTAGEAGLAPLTRKLFNEAVTVRARGATNEQCFTNLQATPDALKETSILDPVSPVVYGVNLCVKI